MPAGKSRSDVGLPVKQVWYSKHIVAKLKMGTLMIRKATPLLLIAMAVGCGRHNSLVRALEIVEDGMVRSRNFLSVILHQGACHLNRASREH